MEKLLENEKRGNFNGNELYINRPGISYTSNFFNNGANTNNRQNYLNPESTLFYYKIRNFKEQSPMNYGLANCTCGCNGDINLHNKAKYPALSVDRQNENKPISPSYEALQRENIEMKETINRLKSENENINEKIYKLETQLHETPSFEKYKNTRPRSVNSTLRTEDRFRQMAAQSYGRRRPDLNFLTDARSYLDQENSYNQKLLEPRELNNIQSSQDFAQSYGQTFNPLRISNFDYPVSRAPGTLNRNDIYTEKPRDYFREIEKNKILLNEFPKRSAYKDSAFQQFKEYPKLRDTYTDSFPQDFNNYQGRFSPENNFINRGYETRSPQNIDFKSYKERRTEKNKERQKGYFNKGFGYRFKNYEERERENKSNLDGFLDDDEDENNNKYIDNDYKENKKRKEDDSEQSSSNNFFARLMKDSKKSKNRDKDFDYKKEKNRKKKDKNARRYSESNSSEVYKKNSSKDSAENKISNRKENRREARNRDKEKDKKENESKKEDNKDQEDGNIEESKVIINESPSKFPNEEVEESKLNDNNMLRGGRNLKSLNVNDNDEKEEVMKSNIGGNGEEFAQKQIPKIELTKEEEEKKNELMEKRNKKHEVIFQDLFSKKPSNPAEGVMEGEEPGINVYFPEKYKKHRDLIKEDISLHFAISNVSLEKYYKIVMVIYDDAFRQNSTPYGETETEMLQLNDKKKSKEITSPDYRIKFTECINLKYAFNEQQYFDIMVIDKNVKTNVSIKECVKIDTATIMGSENQLIRFLFPKTKLFLEIQALTPTVHEFLKIYPKVDSNNKNVDPLSISKPKKVNNNSFVLLLNCGVNFSVSFGIDFTASNNGYDEKDKKVKYTIDDPLSLHSQSKQVPKNDYSYIMEVMGDLLLKYDRDRLIDAYGYGFCKGLKKVKAKVENCWPINNDVNDPYIGSIQELDKTYKNFARGITFKGPTWFSKIIKKKIDDIRKDFAINNLKANLNYHILIIITDGKIEDMDDTKEQIIESSKLPMSIVIIGVGPYSFKEMNQLDMDDKFLAFEKKVKTKLKNGTVKETVKKLAAVRDNVQFIPFSAFKDNYPEVLPDFALEEIPKQCIDYYQYYYRENAKNNNTLNVLNNGDICQKEPTKRTNNNPNEGQLPGANKGPMPPK